MHSLFYDGDDDELFRSYGEYGMDNLLIALMQMLGYKISELKYVEIGVNDPIINNNSYNLYKLGARGVLVDPMPAVRYLSGRTRPEDSFIQTAVMGVPVSDSVTFHVGALKSIHRAFQEEHKIDMNNVKQITVPVISIIIGANRIHSGYAPYGYRRRRYKCGQEHRL